MTPGTDLFTLATRTLDGVLPGVTDWDAPSPCAGWSQRDVLVHVTSTLGKAYQIATGSAEYRNLSDDPHEVDDDAAAAQARWHELAATVRATLATADLARPVETRRGPQPLARALTFPAADVACHAWDLAAGSGQALDLPAPLLDALDTQVRALPEDALRNPTMFGAAVEPAPGASETDRIMAWLGRTRP